jgi:RES domain-containing protein
LGARWNKKDEPAIYTALDRETAIEELRHNLRVNTPPPSRGSFILYSIQIAIEGVVDLGTSARIAGVGLTPLLIAGDDYSACQSVGSAARFLGIRCLQVPSARRTDGANLVIFPDLCTGDFEFEVQAEELLNVGSGPLAP